MLQRTAGGVGESLPHSLQLEWKCSGGKSVRAEKIHSFSFSTPLRDIPVSHLSSQPIKTKKAAVELSINFITMKLILENRDYSQEAELLILSPRVVQTGYNPRQPWRYKDTVRYHSDAIRPVTTEQQQVMTRTQSNRNTFTLPVRP